jgi:excisionase family DNA binding protein
VTIDELATQIATLTTEVRALRSQLPAQLVDLEQAAQHLGVSERTLRRMVATGRVPFRRVGRGLRFNLADLGPAT